MKGIMSFHGDGHQLVGKISEFPTKEAFSEAVLISQGPGIVAPVESIEEGWVRFYPNGTPEHPDSIKGEPFYMTCDKGPGAFRCWFVDYTTTPD